MIFVFGLCEPLIPLLIYPAANHSIGGVVYISVIFGLVTISTMRRMAFTVIKGFDLLPLQKIHRYTHALDGFTIFVL
jgi:nickel/cobalt transporter (NicO) family protein